ncbi:MAG: electron transport complex subunit RsxC [Lentisphaerae bacterium]|jgi:electron transport complex protein RnfC|nr:electron transport complex subunit RsxC [Lentisphaerota bacterium]
MKIIKAPFKFSGGVHPPDKKIFSNAAPLQDLPLPAILKVPFVQHLGAPAKAVVKKGDKVKRGDLIAAASGFISASVHAPTSGTVKGFESLPTAVGRSVEHCVIESDGLDERSELLQPFPDWETRDVSELIERVADAGVVGMGGAGFPTSVKINPPPNKKVHTLIINGAECEPYLTADHRMMLDRTEDVWLGIQIVRKILDVKTVYICIEENKQDAIEKFSKIECDDDVMIVSLKTYYPHGSEKQQIYVTLGYEVPSGGLPADIGCVVGNIGTSVAVKEAVVDGWPLDSRCVTVTGEVVVNPGNFIVRCGTSYDELFEAAGGFRENPAKVISGGPMMGFAVANTDVTVTKTTSGILAQSLAQTMRFTSLPCISCGRCNDVCPMKLLPSDMSCAIEADDIDAAIRLNVSDCFECGCCSYVCPSHRPLVQHFRRAKGVAALNKMLKAKEMEEKAAQARAEAQKKCEIAHAESEAKIESDQIQVAVVKDEISRAWGESVDAHPGAEQSVEASNGKDDNAKPGEQEITE